MKLGEICNWLFLFITVLIKSIYGDKAKSTCSLYYQDRVSLIVENGKARDLFRYDF
jgi:hypothetical protein